MCKVVVQSLWGRTLFSETAEEIGSILLGKEARLPNPCYHESEVFFFFQICESSEFSQLSAICYLGLFGSAKFIIFDNHF
jgi:hypothetical protein